MKILTLSIMIANELKNMIEQENLKEGDKLPVSGSCVRN